MMTLRKGYLAGMLVAALGVSAAPRLTLGLQLFTFKDRSLVESIETAKRLGFTAVELTGVQELGGVFGRHHLKADEMTVQEVAAVSNYLAACGVKAYSYGVTGASNEAGWRRQFEFVRGLGVGMLLVEPDPKALPLVDRLAQTYRIRVHIHNHAKGGPWWDPAFTAKQVAACSSWVGAGSDIGHWVSAGVNPPEGIRQLMASRIFALHFVDCDQDGHACPYGTGRGQLGEVLEELKGLDVPLYLTCEYEEWEPETEAHVAACVRWFKSHIGK